MADKREYARRFGSLFLAGIFLLSTIGLTALIFWQTNDQKKSETELQEQLQSQQDTTNPTGEDMLQGTKLADFTPLTAPVTELQKTDLVEGTGAEAAADSTVTAHYTGALAADGTIFQSSLDSGSPFTSPLSGLIKGWQEGIPGMKVGGKRRLVIPYALAYGEAGSPPSIPGKADLVFDIELISLGE